MYMYILILTVQLCVRYLNLSDIIQPSDTSACTIHPVKQLCYNFEYIISVHGLVTISLQGCNNVVGFSPL